MMKSKRASHTFHIFKVRSFSALFFTIGCITLFAGVIAPLQFTLRSRSWPQVSCVIVHTSATNPSPRIIYKYRVQGVQYIGRKLSSTMPFHNKPRTWKRFYPEGTRTICLVNPTNPSESVLTWGWGFTFFFFLFWSLFMIGAAIQTFRHPLETRINGRKPR